MALIYCKNCGAKISEYAPKCPICGAEQNVQTTQTFFNENVGTAQKKSNNNNTNKSNNVIKWSIVVVLVVVFGYLVYSNMGTGHEYVDLGLSVKWATCNVGANTPEEYGNYYAWGETTTKTSYNESNSVTYWQQISDFSGNATYDVARVNWGGSWRLPTKREMEELQNKCTWSWTTQSGVNGYRVTGPNGNSIFLPAAGFCGGSSRYIVGEGGCYWSSTPNESYTYYAYDLKFGSGGHDVSWSYRYFGLTVRPVSD